MYRDKAGLNVLAKLAAADYLGKSQTPLNDSLKKIAESEALTPHQIQYVASESNKEVWSRLFAMDKTASYDFPLADAKRIIEDLGIKQTPQHIKQADMDYLAPPISTKYASFNPFEAMGVVEDNVKTATARRALKKQLQSRLEKISNAQEEIERLQILNRSQIQNLELEFVKTARTMILEQPFEDREKGLAKIGEFLKSAGHPEHGRMLLAKLSHVLKRQGLIKEADLKAPEHYISDKLPARIINGRHALYITIKTLFDKYETDRELCNRHEIVDSCLPVIKEKIREL